MAYSLLNRFCSLLVDAFLKTGSRCVAGLFLADGLTAHNFGLFNSRKNLIT
jgi:hypothetical protein